MKYPLRLDPEELVMVSVKRSTKGRLLKYIVEHFDEGHITYDELVNLALDSLQKKNFSVDAFPQLDTVKRVKKVKR